MTALLIAGVLISSAAVIWLTLRQAEDLLPGFGPPASFSRLDFEEGGIRVATPDGPRFMEWSALVRVRIRTTDAGPLADDVFWDLESGTGEIVTFTNDDPAIQRFMTEAADRLEGFDHEAIIDAMASTGNDSFLVWSVER